MAVQIRSFSHSYLSTAAQLTEKLRCLCQDPSHPDLFQELSDVPVKEIVVSQNHLALLLGNGYIYRIQYSLKSNSDGSNRDKNDDDGASTSNVPSGSRGPSPRGEQDSSTAYTSFAQRFSSLARGGRAFSRRLIERRQDRLSRALLSRVPTFVPASEVPEDLVEEAMAVLQGKSREVVIRELQRTNLDVNTAVNNLLSRDEDDPHNEDETAQFPSGDELLTLMGTGALVEDELEELLSITSRNRSEDMPSSRLGREGRPMGMYSDPLVAQEIRSWVTLADRAATGNGAAPSSSSGHASSSGSSKNKSSSSRKEQSSGASMYFINKSCWRCNDVDKVFTHIAGLKSELLAVDGKGVLYSWPWGQTHPPSIPHPRLAEFGLQGEKIKHLSAKLLRASVVTESGRVATWLDSSVYKVGHVLEHSATLFPELTGETVIQLVTCELFSAVYTDSGKLMWWGVLPFSERKTLINQFQDKNRSFNTSSGGGGGSVFRGNQIQEGSQVCLRSRPIYSSGCKAIYVKGEMIKCGELQESVFMMSDKCRFKVLSVGDEKEEELEAMDTMEIGWEGTSNQPGPSIGSKRRHPETEGDDDSDKPKEELWSLRDVIFLSPPLSSAPLGRVVKLDGLYAAVLFPTLNKDGGGKDGPPYTGSVDSEKDREGESDENTSKVNKDKSLLSQCRLLRRDDLVVIPTDGSHPDPVCVQATPKKIKLATDSMIVALTADTRSLHALVASHGSLSLCSFNFETCRSSNTCSFPNSSAHFLLQQLPPRSLMRSLPMKLVSLGLSLWLLVDSLGGLYPLARDAVGGMKPLPLLNLAPVHCLVYTPYTSKQSLVTMAVQSQQLIPLIRTGTLNSLRAFLDSLSPAEIERCLKEQTHGGCNVLHLLGTLAPPSPPSPGAPVPQSGSGRGRSSFPSLREIMHQSMHLPATSVVESRLWSIGLGDSDMADDDDTHIDRSVDRSSVSVSLLHHLCTLAPSYREVFMDLMTMVNLIGFTPFMAAVASKSYSAAIELLDLALLLSDYQEDDEEAESLLLAMIFPPGSHCDDNPLFILCRSDPCSFTWTGEEHINQDIFECRTCGLVGSLCCCTECAYTCHRGHDCSFKRASPNAYCDCWERCPCQALARVDENSRMMLLHRLLDLKFLSSRTNSRGEYLIGMLAALVARQTKEQAQWTGKKPSSSSHLRRSSRHEGGLSSTSEVPVHSMTPPKFALKAIAAIMEDWPSIKAVLSYDDSNSRGLEGKGTVGGASEWPFSLSATEQQKILESQQSTKHLDVLVYTMLAKTSHQNIEAMITTLVSRLGPKRENLESLVRCQRLLRSTIRCLVVCELEKMGGPDPHSSSSRKRSSDGEHCFIYKEAMFVLNSLAPLAIPELIMTARSLILPVCMGVARPFLPTLMIDKHKVAEELFTLPPADLFRQMKAPPVPSAATGFGTSSETGSTGGRLSTGRGGGVSDSDSEPGEGDDTHILGDASSTATVGSGPLPFFSDQESSDGEELDSMGDEASLDGVDMEEENYAFAITDSLAGSRVQGATHWAIPDVPGTSNSKKFSRTSARETVSYGTSVTLLSRGFSMLIRLITELMDILLLDGPQPPFVLHSLPTDSREIYDILWAELDGVWQWLATVMDSTESQLRLGYALNATWTEIADNAIKPTGGTSSASSKSSDTPGIENRRGFLNYMLSLMRAESNEHGGALPGLDVSRLEHVAWVMDALVYLLIHVVPPGPEKTTPTTSGGLESSGHGALPEDKRRFFRRSSSTLCLPYPPPSPFAPLAETLPLAEKPHLLHPRQSKELLFGYGQQETMEVWPDTPIDPPPVLPLIDKPVPLKTSLSFPSDNRKSSNVGKPVVLPSKQVLCETSHSLTASVLMGRWCMSVELLSRVFVDTLGKQQNSIFSHLQSFETLERDVRRDMDNLRSMMHKDLQLDVDRARENLLPSLFRQLNNQSEYRRIGSGHQPLCVHRIRVSFKNEPGEGSGVVRSFFTAVAEAVMSEEPLPELDYNVSNTTSRGMSLAEVIDEYTGKVDIECPNPASSSVAELCPLFFQPGKVGYYSIRVGSNTPARINAYRNVGRVIGLALLHSEMMPLPLCRHIYKYLLNRTISWHDMAFFDPVMYEGLRKLILSAHQEPEHIRDMDLSWQVTLGEYEGGRTHPLLTSPSNKPVTTTDVYDYVQHYSELRMIRVVEEPLMAMKSGLYDVLPSYVLESLSAEDMRLLLCGCQQVDIDTLKKITVFSDESKKASDQIVRFKSWFWSIVERMSNREKQDLLYFWTSSPSMPANPESYQPPPSITIRPADDQHLPTSNTCISRLYIPLYSSKALLRSKLLASIKIKAFGFI